MRPVRGWSVYAFPLAVLGVFFVLVAANLNGSSVGMFHEGGIDRALVAGQPRAIRGDEYLIGTPVAVSSVRQGFPDAPYIGLTATDQLALAHGAATWQVLTVFRPQDWGYLVLGASRGLAVHWWMPYVVALLGIYALFVALRFRPMTAALLAVVGALTPYTAWWSAPAPGSVLGFLAFAAAAVLVSLRAKRSRRAVAWACGAGAAIVAAWMVLYPPWFFSLALVVAGVTIGYAVDLRVPWRRLLLTGGLAAGVAGSLLLVWYLGSSEAIRATLGTSYPGSRVSHSGEAKIWQLLSAPLNPMLSGHAGNVLTGTNRSEIASSWFPLPILVAALVVVALRWRRTTTADADRKPSRDISPGVGTFAGVAVAGALLLLWGFADLPDWAGTLVMEQVPGVRLPLALGFAAILLVALAAGVWHEGARPRLELGL